MNTAYLAVLATAVLGAWGWVWLLLRGNHTQWTLDSKGLRLVIFVAWAYMIIPSLLQVALFGRPETISIATQTTLIGYAAQAASVVQVALLGSSCAVAVHHVLASRGRKPRGPILLALSPWLLLTALAFLAAVRLSPLLLVYPAILFAVRASRPSFGVLSTLGWLTVLTAMISLYLGWFTSYGTATAGALVDKALINYTVLTGPLTHGNTLGMVLTLGLPSVFLIRSRIARWVGVAAIVYAVAWTASRTSIAAAVAVFLLMLFARVAPAAFRRFGGWAAVTAAVGAIIWLPLTTTTSHAYSDRGRVWLGSLSAFESAPWLGHGPTAYLSPGTHHLGQWAFHGHNLLVDALYIGGLTLVGLLAVLIFVAARNAIRAYAAGTAFPLLFVVAFLAVGILEVPTNFWMPTAPGLVAWLSLAVLLFGRFPATLGEETDRDQGGVAPQGQPVRVRV